MKAGAFSPGHRTLDSTNKIRRTHCAAGDFSCNIRHGPAAGVDDDIGWRGALERSCQFKGPCFMPIPSRTHLPHAHVSEELFIVGAELTDDRL